MHTPLLYPIGTTQACHFAAGFLKKREIHIADHPSPDVTALLLDIPSFCPDGMLRSGEDIHSYLERLPSKIRIIGGNLNKWIPEKYYKTDLLQDPEYLAQNASITASCALMIAAQRLPITLALAPVLIIGWGRIGKCLAHQLKGMGADPIVTARKESDRALLRMLGYRAASTDSLRKIIPSVRLIFNTAPEPVLNEEDFTNAAECLKIDLASKPGILCRDAIQARGLPGIYAPESSGQLIANTIYRLLMEEL